MAELKMRIIPWLGIKKLTDEDVVEYDLDTQYDYKALVFEWGPIFFLIWGRGVLKDSDGNKRM